MRFRQQAVLRDIDLGIRRGQTVCIIGESGCGKTVMLKLIIGLLHPTRGEVRFDGRDVAELERQGTGARCGCGSGSCSRWPRCSTA